MAKGKVRSLLLLLGSAIVCALLLTLLLIHNYGPSGRYSLKKTLIEPALVYNLAYRDVNNRTGKLTHYLFDGIDLSYYSPKEGKPRNMILAPDSYALIYQLLANDLSLLKPPTTFQPLASLMIKVRTQSHTDSLDESKNFQTVDFAKDHYRVRLHEPANANTWIYFEHLDIDQKILTALFP
jgi:hypothetical protein